MHEEIADLPTSEKIHTGTDERFERRRCVKARSRKGQCAKSPFSYKHALTRMNQLVKDGTAKYLNIYKCHCGYWHLTHKKPRVGQKMYGKK